MDTLTQGLIVAKQGWITAVREEDLLCVYRSVLVQDTDPMMEPINSILNEHHHRILTAHTQPDDNMWFGEGLVTLYRIGEKR